MNIIKINHLTKLLNKKSNTTISLWIYECFLVDPILTQSTYYKSWATSYLWECSDRIEVGTWAVANINIVATGHWCGCNSLPISPK